MRVSPAAIALASAALVGALASASAAADASKPSKPKPVRLTGSVRIVFSGSGQQTYRQYKEWIYQVDNRCGYDKTVENTASLTWTTTWSSVSLRSLARGLAGRPPQSTEPAGRVTGTELRTDCSYPIVLEGWAGTGVCDEGLQFSEPATLDVAAARAGSVVFDLQAPPPALGLPTACALRPRGSQLTTSFKLSLAALQRLAKGRTLRIAVGTASPSLVPYAPEYDCGASEPPYEGIRIADTCKDTVSWAGSVTLTRL